MVDFQVAHGLWLCLIQQNYCQSWNQVKVLILCMAQDNSKTFKQVHKSLHSLSVDSRSQFQ